MSATKGTSPVYLAPHNATRTLSTDVHDAIPTGVWVMGAPLLWAQGFTGKGIKVGIIDSGIDDSHPDLKNKVAKRTNYADNVPTSEYHPHGTHVAGTIAANGNIKGVAPDAQLYDYRVFDSNGSGASYDTITKAVLESINDRCDIVNMSLGGPGDYPPLHDAIKSAVSKGMVVVVAAGNKRSRLETPPFISYPGFYHEVVSVAAVDFNPDSQQLEHQWWSYFNPEVDVVADGFQVYSTIPTGSVVPPYTPYASFSGTSMATPHVAGFCALLLQKSRKVWSTWGLQATDDDKVWAMLLDNTLDLPVSGDSSKALQRFVTVYGELPKRDYSGKWFLPRMKDGSPQA